MQSYTFYANGQWFTVYACTYESAIRRFHLEFPTIDLESATLVKVDAA